MGPLVGSFLLAGLLSLGLAPSAQAACRTGLIDAPTTWSVADSPCMVDQSVWVLEGVTLTIQPGVVVKVNPGLALQIDGTLVARGTSTEPITFTSNASGPSRPARGDWGYLLFTNTSPDAEFDEAGAYLSGSILEHCVVEYAGKADQPAVRLQSTSPFIHRCTVRENLRGGIDASGLDRPIRVEFSTISNNGGLGISIDSTSNITLRVGQVSVAAVGRGAVHQGGKELVGALDLTSVRAVALNTAPLIYYVEEHPRCLPLVEPLIEAIDEGRIAAYTSVITLSEVLVAPFRAHQDELVKKYKAILLHYVFYGQGFKQEMNDAYDC